MSDIFPQPDFSAVIDLIRRSRTEALRAVNTHLIDLYWKIGEYISQRIESENWGDSVVKNLADPKERLAALRWCRYVLHELTR